MANNDNEKSADIKSKPNNSFDNAEINTNVTHSKTVEIRTVEDVMEDSYLRYSMSVIVARALPDVRDGLKPVHRRILYSMDKNGWSENEFPGDELSKKRFPVTLVDFSALRMGQNRAAVQQA